MLFDTGSPLVYVVTDQCESWLCPQKAKYQSLASSTYKPNSDGNKEELAHCYG